MLEELEETYLSASLQEILDGMAAGVATLKAEAGKGALDEGVKDADYFLAVARSLLSGQEAKTALGQGERVAATLKACAGMKMERFSLFGRSRTVDFSQFKVRGHYENSDLLKRYFKAMMWCGRIDLRVAGKESSPRELASAVVLHDLLKRSGKQGALAAVRQAVADLRGPHRLHDLRSVGQAAQGGRHREALGREGAGHAGGAAEEDPGRQARRAGDRRPCLRRAVRRREAGPAALVHGDGAEVRPR